MIITSDIKIPIDKQDEEGHLPGSLVNVKG